MKKPIYVDMTDIVERITALELRQAVIEEQVDIILNPPPPPPYPALPEGRLIGNEWLIGANGAWYNYGRDIGGGIDGFAANVLDAEGNIRHDSIIISRLQQAVDAGINTINWWLFPFGTMKAKPAGIVVDDAQRPIGLRETVYDDLDAMVLVANELGFNWIWTLLNQPETWYDNWLPNYNEDLAALFVPVFERYADEPAVFAYNVAAEVDFSYWYQGKDEAQVVQVMTGIASAIRSSCNQQVTIQSAFADSFETWHSHVDFVSTSWYDYMSQGTYCIICNSADWYNNHFQTDLPPIVVMEFYAGGDVVNGAAYRWEQLYKKEYAGAFGWMLFPKKAGDGMNLDYEELARFAQRVP